MAKIQVPKNILSSLDTNSDKIKDAHLTILWAITLWYNGVGIQHGSRVYHIGSSKPPSLQTLIGCSDSEWTNVYKPAFNDFKNGGDVVEKTILRRKVSWVPTKRVLGFLSDFFAEPLERIVVPHSAFNSRKGHIGDPCESLVHRTGVEQAVSWLYEKGYDWQLYPGELGHPRPDVRGISTIEAGQGTMMNSDIEVISDHNNKKMYAKKYAMFSKDPSRTSLWVFKDRKAAAKGISWLSLTNLSILMGQEYPKCRIANAPYTNPENYALGTLNRYLKQSRDRFEFDCTGMDYVQTIAGLYADRDHHVIRRPVTIWNADTAEITLIHRPDKAASLTVDEFNRGGRFRMKENFRSKPSIIASPSEPSEGPHPKEGVTEQFVSEKYKS